MAAPASRNILKIPGTIVKDPTDLSAAYPYGGTELGAVHSILFRPTPKHYPVTAEEWGEQTVEVIDGATSVVMAFHLRGYDNDALSAIFPDTATATLSKDTVVKYRIDAARAGSKLGDNSFVLLFVPKARVRHRAILLRDAIPVVTEETELAMSMSVEMAIPCLFYGVPDADGDVAEIARVKDITL